MIYLCVDNTYLEVSSMKKFIWGSILYFLGIFGSICITYFPVDNLVSIRNGSYILFPFLGLIGLIIMSIGYRNQQYFIKKYISGIIIIGCGILNLINIDNPLRLLSIILIIGGLLHIINGYKDKKNIK